MYNVQGNMVKLSQSADATCRGLISATDGPMKMELSRGEGFNFFHTCLVSIEQYLILYDLPDCDSIIELSAVLNGDHCQTISYILNFTGVYVCIFFDHICK